jgi:hypothetical protein
MLEDVVVAWDGSARARFGLEWALHRRASTRVHLLRVVGGDGSDPALAAGPRLALDAAVARLRDRRPDLRITGEVVHGAVEQGLLARAVPGSLLVMGVDGRSGRVFPHRSAMLGRIARHATGPVAIVPVQEPAPRGPVVAGVDGTAAGVAAAQVAAAEADAADVSLVAVLVLGDGTAQPGWPDGPLDACARDLEEHFPGLLVRQRTVRGDVRRELLQAAESASLLVIGHHAQPGAGGRLVEDALAGATPPLLFVGEADALWASSAGARPSHVGVA